jgi:tetraacyldisaccharide 4'-kinase
VSAQPASSWAERLERAWLSRGPLACALWPLSLLYGAVTAVRRALYKVGGLTVRTSPVPVIVVGNLIAGGAGKTPTVIALVTALRRRGYTPGVISRGYGGSALEATEVTRASSAAQCGDEPLLIHLRTGAPLMVGRDRAAAAESLAKRHPGLDVIVSDDGLQHLRLSRDAQVLVFDERGAGNGWRLPAGPLRDALPAAVPPRSLVLYNAVRASTPLPGSLARRSLSGLVSLAGWWRGEAASAEALALLRGRPLVAAAGLARPQRFFAMLRDHGLTIDPLPLPDHHAYATLPWPADTPDVIVTEKDAIKLDPAGMGGTRVWVAPLDFALDPSFLDALTALLPPPDPRHGNSPA